MQNIVAAASMPQLAREGLWVREADLLLLVGVPELLQALWQGLAQLRVLDIDIIQTAPLWLQAQHFQRDWSWQEQRQEPGFQGTWLVQVDV